MAPQRRTKANSRECSIEHRGNQWRRHFEHDLAPAGSAAGIFSVGELCAVVAHEIGNPLSGMLTTVQLMERNLVERSDRVDERISNWLQDLRGEIDRLLSLLEKLRSLRVLFDLDRQPISLANAVRELLALESVRYAQCGVRIVEDIPSDLPLVMADSEKLRQILLNLCKNAVEAMKDGGTLSLRGYSTERQVYLDIADTGAGVPDGIRVFEPLVTSKSHGSGLGLVIVQLLISAHGGTISYTSKPGQGTIFHLTFPIPER